MDNTDRRMDGWPHMDYRLRWMVTLQTETHCKAHSLSLLLQRVCYKTLVIIEITAQRAHTFILLTCHIVPPLAQGTHALSDNLLWVSTRQLFTDFCQQAWWSNMTSQDSSSCC